MILAHKKKIGNNWEGLFLANYHVLGTSLHRYLFSISCDVCGLLIDACITLNCFIMQTIFLLGIRWSRPFLRA